MDDPSPFQRSMQRGFESGPDPSEVAEAADIPKPSSRALEEELAAQGRRKDRQDDGTLPKNLMEAVLLVQAMEREGRRVTGNQQALMDFLKHEPGDVLSADLLAAMALLLGSVSKRRKKKNPWLDLRRAGEAARSWLRKVFRFFTG